MWRTGMCRSAAELLTKVRVAQNQAGVVRVVLDVNGVQDYAASLVKKPTRLVIELYRQRTRAIGEARTETAQRATSAWIRRQRSEAKAVDAAVAIASCLGRSLRIDTIAREGSRHRLRSCADKPSQRTAPSKIRLGNADSREVWHEAGPGAADWRSPQPTRDGQSTLTRALGLKIGRIVIDAGHGGHDTGTIGPTGLMEKDLCLDVALRLGKLIQQKLPGARDCLHALRRHVHSAGRADAHRERR